MVIKPTYEELEQRVRELEAIEDKMKRAEETQRKLAATLSAVPDPVTYINRNYCYEIVNEARAKRVGKTVEEFRELNIFGVLKDEQLEKK